MGKTHKIVFLVVLSLVILLLTILFLQDKNIAILNPQGIIASKERRLMYIATLLSLIVVVPVFVMTFVIAWRYREGNDHATYMPEWDHNTWLEAAWWGVPLILIIILSIITWKSTHELDPRKVIKSTNPPLTVQVIALDWKWLFIYPEQNIATINYVRFPEDTPVTFHITADAPMNSFWIPQLGGQIYAMSGMSTHLNLLADNIGSYRGSSANISGQGFADMNFTAQATSEQEFQDWVRSIRQGADGNSLSADTYQALVLPSKNNEIKYFAGVQGGLYDSVVHKFMFAPNAITAHNAPMTGGH
jgi:cytochrome o ubiquinol oxidase subunit II